MLKKNLFILFLIVSQMLMGQKATITVQSRDILTYPYSDPNPMPLLSEGRPEIYPYFSFNGYSLKGVMQKWNVVKLENDYIEVYVMPSDGGKVWGAIEKSTGKEFIYRNEVMKYRNISMRGPWTSGGIEFNFGYIGHNPSTCVPVDYKTVENADGSVSCFVGSLDLPSRTKWSVEIRVPKDKAYFETRAMWTNPTPLPQDYYNWMTAAAVTTPDLEFAYPGTVGLEHSGEANPWPVDKEGRDLSMYANNAFGSDRSAHIVGEYNDFMGGYYHNSRFGFGHWALYDEMPGHKLWLWSQARDGGIWEDLLTDSDGQYMEFQAGRMFNQYGDSKAYKTPISQTPFSPGLTDRWTELWFPVKEIGGLTDVSPMGVMNIEAANGKLEIGINALAFAQGKVIVKSDGKTVFTEEKKFKPMDVFKTTVTINNNADYEVIVEGMDLQYSPSKRKVLSRPFYSSMPKDLVTPTTLYQEGMELKEGRNYRRAKDLFKMCLQKDPLYINAMSALTEIYFRSMQYDSALYFANSALQLDSYDAGANYFAGITYHAQGNLTDALESLGWAARWAEYRPTAYALMAQIQLQLDNKPLTEHYANLALDYDRNNINALQVLAVLYRKSGETVLADKIIQTLSTLDPLSHFADFERYLLHNSSENLTRFTSTITNELPYQTYLELCMVYFGFGLKDDALALLDKSPAHPLVTVWKAYLKDDASLLDAVANTSPAYVFPYRTETLSALKWALSKNNNWKFKYYLALNYAAVQRDAEAMKLFDACAQEPDYAPFYLTRANLERSKDEKKELSDLQSAQKLAPDDWRTYHKLIEYYNTRQNYQMTLSLATEAVKKHKDNPDIGVQYAIALINNGQYSKSLKALEGMNILPSEGARLGKVVFEQASLFMATDFIKNKKYGDAIKMIEKSKEWPEKLGVGKPFDVDIRIQDFLNVYCLEKMKKSGETAALKKSIVDYTNSHINASFSNILAVETLKAMGDKVAAEDMVKKMEGSDNPVQKWVVAVAKNDQSAVSNLEKEFVGNTSLLVIKRVLEVTGK